jgi:hypothetical protein
MDHLRLEAIWSNELVAIVPKVERENVSNLQFEWASIRFE